MKNNYHVNSETGRVNICRAKPGNCPLKNSDGKIVEHFDNKESAKAYSEAELEKTHKPLTSIPKPRIRTYKGITEEENKVLTQTLIEEYNNMEQQLNPNQTEINVLHHYTFAGSSAINRFLHEEMRDYEDTPERIDRNKRDIEKLDNIIEKFGNNSEKKTLYRYISFDKKTNIDEFLEENFVKGNEYTDTGFMSTTEDLSFIAGYARKHSKNRKFIVLEIETNKGISLQREEEKIGDLLTFEKERLLPRDMKFKVEEKSSLKVKIDSSRQKLLKEFNGYYSFNDREIESFPARTFQVVKLVDKNMHEKEEDN